LSTGSSGGGASPEPVPGRWPEFFVVGQAKSGTTALAEMLGQHEQIFIPRIKEPSFFANELLGPEHQGRAMGERRYHKLFAAARDDQLSGDASTQYISSEEAARKIAAVRPDARIIVLFRDPVAFVISMHRQQVQNRYESEADLGRALALEEDRALGRRVPKLAPRRTGLLYTRLARYVEQLARYENEFPAEQILPLIYEDFRADNRGTLAGIFEFLGVSDDVTITPSQANPTVHVRSKGAQRAIYALTALQRSKATRGVVDSVVGAIPEGARARATAFARDRLRESAPREVDPEVVAELRARLRPEVVALGEHLNRDLVGLWGY
jgi:hypothetical protein